MKLTFPEALEDDVVGWTLSYTRRGRLYLHEANTLRELITDAWVHWADPLRSPKLPDGVKDIYDRETEVADLSHRNGGEKPRLHRFQDRAESLHAPEHIEQAGN
ncbi:MAG: hypothetical protein AAFZ18_11510 [Myxococcota bacterium]